MIGLSRLRPHALAYVASVPREVLDDLRSPRCWAAVTALADLERRCEDQRDLVSEILHRAVTAAPDRERRRRLLHVRRQLHRLRVPSEARAACVEVTALPVEDRATLLAYCDGLAALADRERALDRALDEELALAAGRLPAIAEAHEPLVAGIALVSPALYREAVKALAARRASPGRARPGAAELSLARYLLRAITKIAAYSTFTAGARTTWTDAGPALQIVGDGLRQRRVASVNHLPLAVLRLAMPDGRSLAVDPYCAFEEDLVRTVVLGDLDVESRRCAHQRVDLVTLRCDPAVSDALRAGEALPAALTRRLRELHVLVPAPRRLEDPADEVVAIAEAGGLAGVAESLRRCRPLVRAWPTLGPQERAVAVEDVDRSIRGALRAAGLEPRPELLLPPVYEHAELADAEVALARPAWGPVLRDLRLLERSLPLWDVFEPLRPLATAQFVAAYGAGGTCHDVLHFLVSGLRPDEILADPMAAWVRASVPGGSSDRERRFRRRRGELVQGLLDMLGENGGEVAVDGEWLADLGTDAGPGAWTPVRCHAYTGHLCAAGDLVLSTATDGWGRRIAQHDGGRAAAEWGEPLVPAPPSGHEFVELSGTFGFNANLHRPMTPRLLLLPGDDGAGPWVRLTDLVLTHDPLADRLRLRHRLDGVEIDPLYLGVLAPQLLGPLHRALLPFTQVSWTDLPVAELAHRLLDRPDAVRCVPRVRLGSVVLSRRTWIVPAHRFPSWPPAHAMRASFLRDLERWRRQLGLPEEVYVRPLPGPGSGTRSWKPQYVDFRSAFVLAAAARRMRFDTGSVVIEEALPAPEEYAIWSADGCHASTVVIETQVTGGGT